MKKAYSDDEEEKGGKKRKGVEGLKRGGKCEKMRVMADIIEWRMQVFVF